MTFSFISLCFATAVAGVTIVLLELLYEVHKEIRAGNIDLPLVKKSLGIKSPSEEFRKQDDKAFKQAMIDVEKRKREKGLNEVKMTKEAFEELQKILIDTFDEINEGDEE